VDSQNPLRYTVSLGERRPLYCTAVGKLFLAYMAPEAQDEYLHNTRLKPVARHTITDRAALKRNLAEIRRTGLSVTREEVVEGAGGIAAPIFDREGHLSAALVVAGPSPRMNANFARLAKQVKDTARSLSRVLGAADRPGEAR
jgi:DNA-binding IclR family transcriptional regulator